MNFFDDIDMFDEIVLYIETINPSIQGSLPIR